MKQESLYREIEYFMAYFKRTPKIKMGRETFKSMIHFSEEDMYEQETYKGLLLLGCETTIAELSFGFVLY